MNTPSAPSRSEPSNALPLGTRLGEFELRQVLGVGGFGIVYLAFDHSLRREVAVKEYMPASMAGRTATLHVSVRSQSDAENFALGLKSFVNEAQLLAGFNHASLLKVYRIWEANGTAYMAMPVMRGRTLKDVAQELAAAPNETWLRGLLMPLLDAIEKLHAEGVYHRDIAPDNIQIDPEGHPVLLDFGAARRVLGDASRTLTAILKPAYAPVEQYGEAGAVRQGPWTDIYALGATLHFVLLKRPPAPATTRTVHDEASLLTTASLPGCSENFLRTLDWMMAPRPAERPQSVAALREVLNSGRAPPWPAAAHKMAGTLPEDADRTIVNKRPNPAAMMPMPEFDPDATHVVTTHRPPWPMPPSTPSVAPPVTPSISPPMQTSHTHVPTQPAPAELRRPQGLVSTPVPAPTPSVAAEPARKRDLTPVWLGVAGLVAAVALAAAFWPAGDKPATTAAATGAVAGAAVAPLPAPTPATVAGQAAPAAVVAPVAAPVVAGAPTPEPAPLPNTPPPNVAPSVAPAAPSPAAPTPARPDVTVRPSSPAPAKSPVRTGSASPAGAQGSSGLPRDRPPGYGGYTEGGRPVTPTQQPAPSYSAPATPASPGSPAYPAANTPAYAPAQTPEPAAPVPTATVPPAATAPAAVKTPEGTCGTRNPLRYFVCMERECLRSEFASHPDCQQWRKNAKRE